MTLQFPILEPDLAYLGASLFLPKSRVIETPLRNSLTFGDGKDGEPRVLVKEHPHHFEVPRNYRPVEVLEKWGLEVVDLRPSQFEETSLRPKPGFRFRPHQVPAWGAMCEQFDARRDMTLRLDTGRGKTVLGLRYGALTGGPLLVVSWQRAHLENWALDLRKLFDLDTEIGWIRDEQMEWDREVVFITTSTLIRRHETGALPPEFYSRFSLVIYDEAHHQAAPRFAVGSELFQGLRLALTATLKRKDRCEGIITMHLGRVAYDDPAEDALVPEIHIFPTGAELPSDDPDILDITGEVHVGLLRAKLAQLPSRCQALVDRVKMRLSEGRVVYVASHSKDLAYELRRLLDVAGLNPGFITGDDKDAVVRLQQLNQYPVVVVTVGVGKEAYNRQELSALLLATPMPADSYAPTEWLQLVGRILRPVPGKPDPVVDIPYDGGIEMSRGMTYSVIRWCNNQGWTVHREDQPCKKSPSRTRLWRA